MVEINDPIAGSGYYLNVCHQPYKWAQGLFGGPVTNNENINIDGSKILTSTAVWPLRNINIDDRK